MIRYLIKNNIKLLSRNIVNVFLYIFAPIAVMAVLISAFSSMMEKYEGIDKFEVGYKVESGSVFETQIDNIKNVLKEQGITAVMIDTDNPKECIDDNGFGGYVEFSKNSYKLHLSEDKEVEGRMLEYIVTSCVDEINLNMKKANENIETDKLGANVEKTIADESVTNKEFTVSHQRHMPEVSSTDYYGIIWIIYFSWCSILCLTGIYSSEKKHNLVRKYRVSNLNELQIYLSKFIPSTLVIMISLMISTFISIFALGVHWGNLLLSFAIVLSSSLAALALGIMLQSIFESFVVTIILVFGLVWVMGFFGGTFETYMFLNVSESVKLLSPLYHANRACVELSVMGHSQYVVSAISYTLLIAFACSVVAVCAGVIRRRGRA